MTLLAVLFLLWPLASLALAAEPIPAGTIRVIDGDTIAIGAEYIRIIGMDAPETRMAKCPEERRRGELAKAALARLLDHGASIERKRRDKYRRTLAIVTVDGVDVAATMIRLGEARPYDGKRRLPWCR